MKRSKLIACQNDCRAILTAIAYQMLAPTQMQLPTLHVPSLQRLTYPIARVQKKRKPRNQSFKFAFDRFFLLEFFFARNIVL